MSLRCCAPGVIWPEFVLFCMYNWSPWVRADLTRAQSAPPRPTRQGAPRPDGEVESTPPPRKKRVRATSRGTAEAHGAETTK